MSREKIWRENEKAHCQEQVFWLSLFMHGLHWLSPTMTWFQALPVYMFTYTPWKKDSTCRENVPKSSNPDFSCSFWGGKETISRGKEFLGKAKARKTLASNYSLLINLHEYQKLWCCLLLYHRSKLRDFAIPHKCKKTEFWDTFRSWGLFHYSDIYRLIYMRRCIVSKDLHPHQYLKQTILVKKKAVKGLTGFLLHAQSIFRFIFIPKSTYKDSECSI